MSPQDQRLRQLADQAVRDIVELDGQVAHGEIGESDAGQLRACYEALAAQFLGALDAGGPPAPAPPPAPRAWSLAYLLAGVLAVVTALVLLPASLIDRPVGGFVTGNEAVQGGAPALDAAATVTDAQLEEVVAANPGVVGMRPALADRYVAQGDFGPAMRHYLDALRREPDNAEAHAHLAWLLLQIGRPQDGLESVDRALVLDPTLDDALWFRANIALDGLGEPAAALASDPCPAPQPGAPEPAGPLRSVVVPCLGGPGEVDLAAALAGRPALLNVWASWCAPCRAEIPVLDEYANRPGAIPVIGVDVRDDAAAALRLMAELGAGYPSVVDTSGELWQALEVPLAIPTTYVLGSDGSLQRVNPPVVFADADEVAATVQRYLADPP